VHSGFRDDIGVETVAEIDRINVVTAQHTKLARVLYHVLVCLPPELGTTSYPELDLDPSSSEPPKVDREKRNETHHSRSLYIIVKKTCKNRLTALIRTANRYSHASPDIMTWVL
jgi:hypothetical protein